jgi:hypothetical protein
VYLGIFDVLEILSADRAFVHDNSITYSRSEFVSLESVSGTFGSGIKHLVTLWTFKLRFVHRANQPVVNSFNTAEMRFDVTKSTLRDANKPFDKIRSTIIKVTIKPQHRGKCRVQMHQVT